MSTSSTYCQKIKFMSVFIFLKKFPSTADKQLSFLSPLHYHFSGISGENRVSACVPFAIFTHTSRFLSDPFKRAAGPHICCFLLLRALPWSLPDFSFLRSELKSQFFRGIPWFLNQSFLLYFFITSSISLITLLHRVMIILEIVFFPSQLIHDLFLN